MRLRHLHAKRCSKCRDYWPATTDYFRPHKKYRDGLRTQCRQCERDYAKSWNQRHPEQVKAKNDRYHAAHREQDRDAALAYYYVYQAPNPAYRAGRRRYMQQWWNGTGGQRHNAKRRQAYTENPDPIKARNRQWYRTNPHPDRSPYFAAYRATHKPELAAYNSRWRQENPHKHCAAQSRRRVRLAGGLVEPYDRLAIYARDGGKCHICGRRVTLKTFTIDHLIAVVKGGHDTPAYVAIAHKSCNSRMGVHRLPAQLRLF